MASAEDTVGEEQALPANGIKVVDNVKQGEEEEDDLPMLSSQALAALKEFLEEQNGELAAAEDAEEMALVSEDWRLSQFWYDRSTAEAVVAEVTTLSETLPSPRIACIACPTLYVYLKKIVPDLSVQLLEYDKRFEQYGDEFSFYDYNLAVDLPPSLKHSFSIVVADPPYLSKECLEKVTETVKFLSTPEESYVLLLTGEVQKDLAADLLGLHPCGFHPQHANKLGNEFRLFTSYDPGARLRGWDNES